MTTGETLAVGAGILIVLAWILVIIASIAAWITHVIVCIKASAWVLLAFGCIVAPVGVVHGVGVWLGIF
ncbi:hypothetical protein [Rhizobium sp. 16-449-1b]|uniref:hypothetical protein n=1 Tax=Rhizobium sp. 16-449-1b TaxID=2819989 RepID=UPI001FFE15D9|nr:hypothetical protein [Rhizobium sp. 16-449-1b]